MNKRRRYLAKRRRAIAKRPRYITVSFDWRLIDMSWADTPDMHAAFAAVARRWSDAYDAEMALKIYAELADGRCADV